MKVEIGGLFGRLTVTELLPKYRARVLCQCGTDKTVGRETLIRGSAKSCGCLRREMVSAKNLSHGGAGSKLYAVWRSMWDRCTRPGCKAYPRYGGRGVVVDPRWADYAVFVKDVGHPPGPGHTLERVKNDCGYTPSNVVWATRREQSRNTSRTRNYQIGDKCQCLKDWALEAGVPYGTVRFRLSRGKTIEEALNIRSATDN